MYAPIIFANIKLFIILKFVIRKYLIFADHFQSKFGI